MPTENPFAVTWTGDGRALISWRGKHVRTLAGAKADWLRKRADGASDDELQLLLARCTGNFKRGNERRTRSR